jgi:transcriptional regulator with XRE-family HTH domain
VRSAVEGFGARLRRLRLERGLSCTQLASRVGVTESAIRQMENGQTKIASFVVGLRIAKELGIAAWYLAHGRAGDEGDG